jgi:acyl-CoA thioester hydrolase
MEDTNNELYEYSFEVRWSDLDPNFHLRGSAYFDLCDHARLSFFAERGIPVEDWRSFNAGPVIIEQNMKYVKEVKYKELIIVRLSIDKLIKNKIISFKHIFINEQNETLAHAHVLIGVLDLGTRRLMDLPIIITKALNLEN